MKTKEEEEDKEEEEMEGEDDALICFLPLYSSRSSYQGHFGRCWAFVGLL